MNHGRGAPRKRRPGMGTISVLGLCVLGALWAHSRGVFDFALENPQDILRLTLQHLRLVGSAGALAVILGVPTGILVTRGFMRPLRDLTLTLLSICQTVPSLAVLAMAMGFLGIGMKTAVFGLVVYALLPIIRNTVAGLRAVDPVLLEAARGMGMTPWQTLIRVELPNALLVIMAGIRTSLVVTVGAATIAYLIGGGGLGDLIFTGISLVDTGLMLSGAIPTALLALGTNWSLGRLERRIMSKGLVTE